MTRKSLALVAAIMIAISVPAIAGATWSNYTPASTYWTYPTVGQTSGTNYWTNNRIYKPSGYHFFLGYNDGSWHYSTDNTSTDPFAWPAYGYNYLLCAWDYNADPGVNTVGPLTCQQYI